MPHRVRMVVYLHQQARRLQVGYDFLAAGKAIHPLVGASILVHLAGFGHHVEHRQVVTTAHVKIVGIVRGGNLDRTGTKLWVDKVILDQRDFTAQNRQQQGSALELVKTLIAGVHRYGGIAQQRLGAGGRHHHALVLAPPLDRIADMPEMAGLIFVLALFVR